MRKRGEEDFAVRANPLDYGAVLAGDDKAGQVKENVGETLVADLLLDHGFDYRQLEETSDNDEEVEESYLAGIDVLRRRVPFCLRKCPENHEFICFRYFT